MRFSEQIRRITTIAAVAIGLPVLAAAAPRDEASRIPIFNFGQVSSTYYRGSELKADSASALAKMGVKTVIDLRSDGDFDASEPDFVAAAGISYVRLPMTTRKVPTSQQISTFLSLVTDPANQPVYVHCVEGRHRTGVMTALYRMTVEGWTADRAFDEMKHYRFGADFLHPEFKQFVFAYHPIPLPGTQQAAGPVATAN